MYPKDLSHLSYNPKLDGLRCFAVCAVITGHWIAWDTDCRLVQAIPWANGVILFFVLSGFLISNILFSLRETTESRNISIKGAFKIFYARRVLRIFPAYFALLFLLYCLDHENTRALFPWLLTFTSNLFQCIEATFVGHFNHFWSLAVEEQFYLLWPFLILLANKKHLLKLIVACMLLSVLSRAFCFFYIPQNWFYAAFFTLNLFFPLCLGALLAYARRYSDRLCRFLRSTTALCFFVSLYVIAVYLNTVVFHSAFFVVVIDQYLFSIACAFIIFKAADPRSNFGNKILSNSLVVFLGKISYGLYLYHLFTVDLFWRVLVPDGAGLESRYLVWSLYFAVTLGIALFSYYVIERPFNRLKRKFVYVEVNRLPLKNSDRSP